MRKILLWAFLINLLMLFTACETEKTEDDWLKELRDRRTRDAALMYVQTHKTKAAVPILLQLVEKRYTTIPSIYTLGLIGDPVAVPKLIEVLKQVAIKDSVDLDRMTEQLCMSLGMIGDKAAVEPLLWVLENPNAGAMGKAGAVQALGMIGDKRAEPKLIEMLMNPSENLVIRHYAAISLGEIKAEKAGEALCYALFVDDETGRNLFRDAQLSMIQIGNQDIVDNLIKCYDLQNVKANELAQSIKLKPEWIQIKAINVMGQMRDDRLMPKMIEEFEKGLNDKIVYELYAKVIQAIGVAANIKAEPVLAKAFMTTPKSTEYLNEKEIIANALIDIGQSEHLDAFMSIAEKGDMNLKNPYGKPESYAQYCLAAANVVTMLGDATYVDRYKKFLESGKCKAPIYGLKETTPKLLSSFTKRLEAAAECKDDMNCWLGKLKSDNWAERQKAIYVLANTGDKEKYSKAVLETMYYPNEQVRDAVVYFAWKMATPETIVNYFSLWQEQKLNKEFQKTTENLGYVLTWHMREMGLDTPEKKKEIEQKATELSTARKDSLKGAAAPADGAAKKDGEQAGTGEEGDWQKI